MPNFLSTGCNLSEKMGLVENADDLYAIRKLRNDIAHEYCLDDITKIFKPLLDYSELLLKIIGDVTAHIEKLTHI